MARFALSYGVTRDYQYRFFTPLVFAGGLAFLALFSFINFASSGFILVVKYSPDPNGTVAQSWSYGMPEFLASKSKPFCQPSSINRQTTIAFNDSTLLYTVASIRSYENDTILPSLVYLNNPLEACNISQVTINLERAGGRTAGQIAAASWGITVSGMSTCRIELDAGPVEVNITAEWVPFSTTTTMFEGQSGSFERTYTSSANSFWGQSLLANYRIFLKRKLDDDSDITKHELRFVPRNTGESITDLSFFRIDYRSVILLNQEDGSIQHWVKYNEDNATVGELDARGLTYYPTADNLAKSFFSVVLTDLGQKTAEQNILQDPVLLQYFTANFSATLAENADTTGSGPAAEDYNTLKATTGPPEVPTATLAVNYLCNVPQRKPWSELLVSILVADLVFMRALWSIFTLAMSGWMKSEGQRGNWCEGCLKTVDSLNESKKEECPAPNSQENGDRSPGTPLLDLESRDSSQQHRPASNSQENGDRSPGIPLLGLRSSDSSQRGLEHRQSLGS